MSRQAQPETKQRQVGLGQAAKGRHRSVRFSFMFFCTNDQKLGLLNCGAIAGVRHSPSGALTNALALAGGLSTVELSMPVHGHEPAGQVVPELEGHVGVLGHEVVEQEQPRRMLSTSAMTLDAPGPHASTREALVSNSLRSCVYGSVASTAVISSGEPVSTRTCTS